ncbi:hypothetical protein EV401DRAFT_2124659 [Pisolithus croceorrhizus]|nr:hypothetical protein EV401DRAFT_2124659 [Pisolithus croceorrhizus]
MVDHIDVSTQFTEDAFAKQDHHCERPKCGQLIRQGEPEFYIATIEPGQRGQQVCSSCNLHYLRKPSTMVRKTVDTSNSSSNIPLGDHALPDALKIQKLVNAAQRGLSINPPCVVPVSHSPDIAVPSTWLAECKPLPLSQPGYMPQQARPGASPMLPPATLPPHLGYTSEHSCYNQEYDWWAQWTYTSPPAETITLKILVHFEGGPKHGHSQSTPFGNTCEGKKDIDAHICAHDLVPIALQMIIPKVKKFCPMFPWHFDEFNVCDMDWVDLGEHHSLVPYFYSQCLQPTHKNARGMAFKSKQFTLYVVVPAAQWVEYEAFMEKEDSATITSKDTSDNSKTSSAHVPSTVASTTTGDVMNVVNHPFHLHLAQTTFMPACISAQVATSTPGNEPGDVHHAVIAMTPAANHTVLSPPPATMSPPRKIPTLTPFMSPSWTKLREALKSGGTSELNVDQAHSQLTKGLAKPKFGGTLCGVYLLEEKIEGGSDTFIKYIHNMDCGPSLSTDMDGYKITEFLAFTQHVQYAKSGGLVIVSDYQGSGTLLTDPQILTDLESALSGLDSFVFPYWKELPTFWDALAFMIAKGIEDILSDIPNYKGAVCTMQSTVPVLSSRTEDTPTPVVPATSTPTVNNTSSTDEDCKPNMSQDMPCSTRCPIVYTHVCNLHGVIESRFYMSDWEPPTESAAEVLGVHAVKYLEAHGYVESAVAHIVVTYCTSCTEHEFALSLAKSGFPLTEGLFLWYLFNL